MAPGWRKSALKSAAGPAQTEYFGVRHKSYMAFKDYLKEEEYVVVEIVFRSLTPAKPPTKKLKPGIQDENKDNKSWGLSVNMVVLRPIYCG